MAVAQMAGKNSWRGWGGGGSEASVEEGQEGEAGDLLECDLPCCEAHLKFHSI